MVSQLIHLRELLLGAVEGYWNRRTDDGLAPARNDLL
ncbi:hypothetical protein SAMN06272721_1381, partial [Arthrobacter sp. P2b]